MGSHYAVRTVTCTTCGVEFSGRIKPTPPHRCLGCGIAAQARAALEMRRGEGPAFDAWQAGMIKVGKRIARRQRKHT